MPAAAAAPTPAPAPVQHRPEHHEFSAQVDGQTSLLQYRLTDKMMTITHTEVPPALEGRGIAAALTRAALDHARTHGWRVRPLCSYARTYFQRHPEASDLLA